MTGSEVFALRQRLELTQGLLAGLIGVHVRTIARYEQHPDEAIPEPIGKLMRMIEEKPLTEGERAERNARDAYGTTDQKAE